MRKWKFEWRGKLPSSAYEELEVWISVLLALAAALLLYATLTAQAARAIELASAGADTMPAGAQWEAAFLKTVTPGPLLRWLGAFALIGAGSLLVAAHLPRRTS